MGRHARPGPASSPDAERAKVALSVIALRVGAAVGAALLAWLASVVQGLTDRTTDVREQLEIAVPGITEQLGQLGRDVAGIDPPTVTVEAPLPVLDGNDIGPAVGPAVPGTVPAATPIRVQVTNTQPRSSTPSSSTRAPSSTPSSTAPAGPGRAPTSPPAPVPCPYPPPLDALLCPPAG